MAYLTTWDEYSGKECKKKVSFRFCSNANPKGFEISLPDAPDGRRQSVIVTLKEFFKSLEG
jgi:hypothetical protein